MNKRAKLFLLITLCCSGCGEYNTNGEVNHSLNYSVNDNVQVESIDWNTSNYDNNKKYTLKKYTSEEKNIKVDAELSFYLDDFELPLSLTFKFNTYPDQSKLYYYITDCYNVTLEEDYGKYTTLTFNDLYVSSLELEAMYDRTLNYKIKINALIRYGGGLM